MTTPLVESQDYVLTVDAMGAADWPTWEAVGLVVNGQPIPAVHERFAPERPGSVSIRLQARLTPEVVAAQPGYTRIELTVPQTKRALSHVRVLESFDTYHQDMREACLR